MTIPIAKAQTNDSNFHFQNFIKNSLTTLLLKIDNEKLYEESFGNITITFLSYFRYNAIDWAARSHNIDCNRGGTSNKFVVDVCIIKNENNNQKVEWLDRNAIKLWKLPFKHTWNLDEQSKNEKEYELDDNDPTYLKLTTKDDVLKLIQQQYCLAFNYSKEKYNRSIYELNEEELRGILKKSSEGIIYIYTYYITKKT